MSRFLSRRWHARVAAMALAALCGGGLAAPAQAAELTLDYQCEYPLIGKRLLTVEIDTTIPSSWPERTPTEAWEISAKATAKEQTLIGLQLVSAASVEGEALARSTVNIVGPVGGLVTLPVNVPITVPSTPAVGDASGDLVLTASGQTPALTLPTYGPGEITVDSLQLNLIARKADGTTVTTFSSIQPGPPSDDNPDTFDVYCELDPATQSTKLKDITVIALNSCGEPELFASRDEDMVQIMCSVEGPTQPGPATVTAITDVSAKLCWGASTDDIGVVAYEVYNGLNKLGETSDTCLELTDLTPATDYTLYILARDAGGNLSDERAVSFETRPSDIVPPSQPGPASVSSVTPTTAKLCWGASTDNVGVIAYDVFDGATKLATVSAGSWSADACADLVGLQPGTTYSLRIVARDAAGAVSLPREVSFRTPSAQPTVIPYSYALKGATVLRNLTAGTLPLSGSLDAKLRLETQKFEADLKLNATKGNLKALGFLPVRATVSFTNAAKTTGAVGAGGAVTSNSKVNIRLSSVNVFGIPLVAGNCRTQKPSDINLKSAPGFDILVGGRLTGTYAISNLIDCGPLTVLVSPLTAGSGNTITVDLTKQ